MFELAHVAGVFGCRVISVVRLEQGRTSSLNNTLSAIRCGFRLLWGRCLTPGGREGGLLQIWCFWGCPCKLIGAWSGPMSRVLWFWCGACFCGCPCKLAEAWSGLLVFVCVLHRHRGATFYSDGRLRPAGHRPAQSLA